MSSAAVNDSPQRIAIIGAGMIGTTLASRLTASGADLRIGARDPDSVARALNDRFPNLTVTGIAAAIDAADVLILAIPGANVEAFLGEWGRTIGRRIALDATNNLDADGTLHSIPHWRKHAPSAAVFRAFCSTGWETFADPYFDGVQADLLYCGPDGPARATAEHVIEAVGVRPVWLGDESTADLLDAVARLWFQLAFKAGRGRNIAFKLLERP